MKNVNSGASLLPDIARYTFGYGAERLPAKARSSVYFRL